MSNFTPEQIDEILELFFENMAHRQYIGARYVPIIGRKDEESTEWDGGLAPYEPLTIVLYQGNSYTSRQFVPAGVEITNDEFWANTGNYNAQVEQYRQEVLTFAESIEDNTEAIAANTEDIAANTDAITDNANDIADLQNQMLSFDATVKNALFVYDIHEMLEINAEINVTSAYRLWVIYNQLTKELYFSGILAATPADGFTRGTNVKLFKLPAAIPYPTENSQVFVYAACKCLDGNLNATDSNGYYSPLTINDDGEVIVNNLTGFTSPTKVKNIVIEQNVTQYPRYVVDTV